jgi:hypothetical protein
MSESSVKFIALDDADDAIIVASTAQSRDSTWVSASVIETSVTTSSEKSIVIDEGTQIVEVLSSAYYESSEFDTLPMVAEIVSGPTDDLYESSAKNRGWVKLSSTLSELGVDVQAEAVDVESKGERVIGWDTIFLRLLDLSLFVGEEIFKLLVAAAPSITETVVTATERAANAIEGKGSTSLKSLRRGAQPASRQPSTAPGLSKRSK